METVHIDQAGPYKAFGRVPLPDHVRRQRFAVDAAVRDKDQVGDHRIRPDVPLRHRRHGATTLFSDGQRWGIHRPQLH